MYCLQKSRQEGIHDNGNRLVFDQHVQKELDIRVGGVVLQLLQGFTPSGRLLGVGVVQDRKAQEVLIVQQLLKLIGAVGVKLDDGVFGFSQVSSGDLLLLQLGVFLGDDLVAEIVHEVGYQWNAKHLLNQGI